MCIDADHAKSVERELLSLLQQQVLVSERLLQESRKANEQIATLVQSQRQTLQEQVQTTHILRQMFVDISTLMQSMAEEGSDEDPTIHTYIDGKPIRY